MDELIYLACPYSHIDKNVMIDRFNKVNFVAAKLMEQGKYIFSPISHTHPIAEIGDLPKDWTYWEGYDRLVISKCDRLIVLMLDGWEKSSGVTAEISIAITSNIPVEYIKYEDYYDN